MTLCRTTPHRSTETRSERKHTGNTESWLPNHYWVAAVGFVLYGLVFVKNAWVTEDAYIVFRSLEQLFAGNGPVWNPHERVQVFTSVLWYWLSAAARSISTDVYLNALVLSAICNVLMLAIVYRMLRNGVKALLFVGLLTCSNGFFDYTSAGLENPLGYFLLVVFLKHYYRLFEARPSDDARRAHVLWRVPLLFGLILLCRHDLATLLLPPVGYALFAHSRPLGLKSSCVACLVGFLPFVGWTLFSLIYYVSIFPNTAYAKLNTGIDRLDLLTQGGRYLLESLRHDLVTPLSVVTAIVASLLARKRYHRYLGYGVLANVAYVAWVGGDFMAGRFLSYAYLLSVAYLLVFTHKITARHRIGRIWFSMLHQRERAIIALAFVLFYALWYPHTPVNSPFQYENRAMRNGIADERGFHCEACSLWKYLSYSQGNEACFPATDWTTAGMELSRSDAACQEVNHIGIFGYFAGTEKILIDEFAISDPFLARLPIVDAKKWRIGHFQRSIPQGYLKSIVADNAALEDPHLNDFYQRIRLITQSKNLLATDRIKAIIAMNLGKYNHLLRPHLEAVEDR